MVPMTTTDARAQLGQIAARFDAGDLEPVVFGPHRRPQAVIVPFAVWEQLLEPVEDELDAHSARARLAADTGARYSTTEVALRVARSIPDRFAELLRAALGSRAYIAPTGSGLAIDPQRWGRSHGRQRIGWTDGTKVWLEPTTAFAAADAQARADSSPLNVTKRRIGLELRDAGILRPEPAGEGLRTEVRVWLDGQRRRVWEVWADWLQP